MHEACSMLSFKHEAECMMFPSIVQHTLPFPQAAKKAIKECEGKRGHIKKCKRKGKYKGVYRKKGT